MRLMEKMNCGVIYAVKLNYSGNWYDSIASFMSKYTDTPVGHYSHAILETRLICALADLMDNMTNPSSLWYEYWHFKRYPWSKSDFDAMCSSLSTVAVKDEFGNYINGFRPREEFELCLE